MKIKFLLTIFLLAANCFLCLGQEYCVPARREIRHKIKVYPQDNSLQERVTRASGDYIMREFPTTGEVKGVVILAAFADVPFSTDSASIHTLLSNRYNAVDYTEEVNFVEYSKIYNDTLSLRVTIPGSVSDYFRTQSLGHFVPQFDVIGPVTLDHARAYYGANTSAGRDKNTSGMVSDACQKAYSMGLTDFTDYDNDGDGVVDFVYVVYAGSDEAQTGIEECIWAKSSNISLTLGDMRIKSYACSGELVIDLPVVSGIGTFVHEFGHVLGLPDFYNTKEDDSTMDVWSVMDYGMYNAEGFVPCGYTAFERYSLGWLPLHTLDAPATLSIGTTDEEGRGYRIFTSDADTASFYMVENIRREGWNRYAASEGLMIYETTYLKSAWQNNEVNVDDMHRHCIVPANNDYSYRTANKHLFGKANHDFTLTSTPASITQFGVSMDKPLTDINYDAETGRTTFHFCGGNGIENSQITNSNSHIKYDLQGRPITFPTQGLYIQDGKKHYNE